MTCLPIGGPQISTYSDIGLAAPASSKLAGIQISASVIRVTLIRRVICVGAHSSYEMNKALPAPEADGSVVIAYPDGRRDYFAYNSSSESFRLRHLPMPAWSKTVATTP